MAASGPAPGLDARGPAPGLDALGGLLEVALARVPLADHGRLAGTSRALRRLVHSRTLALTRKTVGCTEYGLLIFGYRGEYYDQDEEERHAPALVCPTHSLEKLGFVMPLKILPPHEVPPHDEDYLVEFTTAYSGDDKLVICGDGNFSRDVLVYDTKRHEFVRDDKLPDRLPVIMHGQVTAFLEGSLVVAAGGTQGPAPNWAYSWDERLQTWQTLPPIPTATSHPGYCVMGSRLYVIGGYSRDFTNLDVYQPIASPHGTWHTTRLQIFDGSTRSWSLGPPLTALKERGEVTRSAAVSAVAFEGCVYVFVKRQGDKRMGGSSRHVYKYDPDAEAWSESTPLPVTPSHLVACVHNRRLVVAGVFGEEEPQGLEMRPRVTFMYALHDRTWRHVPTRNGHEVLWPRGGLLSLVPFPLRLRSPM